MELDFSRFIDFLDPHDGEVDAFDGTEAAVSLIIDNSPRPEILFIRRAEREGDPWSGHMALPGGKKEDQDSHLLETAIRETREEVGIDLDVSQCVGRLPAHAPRMSQGKFRIHPYIFHVDNHHDLTLQPSEVQSAHHLPLKELITLDFYQWKPFSFREFRDVKLPAFVKEDITIWGVTYVFLTELLARISNDDLLEKHFCHPQWEEFIRKHPYRDK